VDESLASNRVPAGSTPADDDEDIPVAQVVEDGEDLAGLEAIDEENGRTEHVASSVAPVPSSKRSRPGSRFAVRFAAGTVCLAGLVTAGLVVAHFVGTPSGQPTPAPRRQPDPRRVERVAPPQNQEDEPGALPGRPSGQTEEPTALPGRTADTIDDAPVPGSESPEAAGPPVFINGVAFDPTSLERIPTQPASPDAAPLSGGAVPPDPSEPQTNADAAAAERPAASPPGPEPEQIEHLRILRFSDDSKEKDCATVVARDGEAAYALRGPDLYRIALPALSITRHRVTPCGGQLAVTAVGVVVVHNRQLHLYDDETLALRAAYQLPGEVHLMAASPESARMAFSWLPAETAWDAYRNVDYLGIVDLAEEQVLLNRPRWELTPKGRYDSYPLAIVDGLLLLGDQDLLCAASRDRRSVWSLHHFVMHPDHLEYRGASRRLLARPESIVAGPQPGQLMLSCRPWANASLAYRNTSRYATEVVSLADLANAPVKAAAEATTRVAADLETGDLYGWRPGETREGKILQRFLANGTRADAVFIPVEAGAISTVSVVPLPQSGDVLVQGANELCLVRFRNLSEPAVAPDASTERTVPFAEITANDDSVTYRITHRATLPSHPETAVRVLFSPDGRSLLSTGSTHNGNSSICQNAFLRESATGRLLHVFDSTYGGVLGGAFSPDGDVVATSDLGGRVSFWDAETGTLLNRIPGRSAICVNWIPGTDRVAVARGNDRQVQVWTREAEMVWEAKSHTQSVWELDVSPDGTWIASGSADGTCKIWNAEDGTLWHTLKNEPSTWITAMAISPDGKSLAVGDNYSNIRLWDPRTGGVQRDLRGGSKDHHRSVHSLAYHPSGQILAAGEVSSGQGSAITFWDAVGGRPLGQIDPQAKAVHDIAFSPDGRTMALACEPGAVKLFDVRLAAAE
jgi:WD40 repeat protein